LAYLGVVDPRLKIYGLANVRVVDASVIPLTTGVAIQSTVYAIAEKVRPDLQISVFFYAL
jgi:choline dehydrogenase-like flavoprotein